MTTDTSRRVLRLVGPSLGLDLTVRYAEILGQRLVDFAPRLREAAAAQAAAGTKLAVTYRDHYGTPTRAWPTDSMEWLMKRTPELTVTPADPGDPMVV
jgi:hypothetical protein